MQIKHLTTLLLTLLVSGSLWADDDLPSVLYCSLGITQVEIYFNDNGKHWIDIKYAYKVKPRRIDIKKLEVTPSIIRFDLKFIGGGLGRILFMVNRVTGLSEGTLGSGTCSLQKPIEQRKF